MGGRNWCALCIEPYKSRGNPVCNEFNAKLALLAASFLSSVMLAAGFYRLSQRLGLTLKNELNAYF